MTRPVALLLSVFLPFLPVHLLWGDAAPPASVPADLVVLNAKIWTVNKKQPQAEALAILKERIVYVGDTKKARNQKAFDAGLLGVFVPWCLCV